MSQLSKLAELVALAREPSSARRRELLREITDLFFACAEKSAAELEQFDHVLTRLSEDMEEEVRIELAHRFADAERAPHALITQLARDAATPVAAPVLARSPAIPDGDLMWVVRNGDQERLRAVSERRGLAEPVTDVIVARGDDATLGALVKNETAALSRRSAETVVDRAVANAALQEAVVERKSLPVDLLNELYFVVEARLRERILQRNASLDPAALQAALAAGRKRLAARDGALPPDYLACEEQVRHLKANGGLTSAALAAMLRAGERTKFLLALAESTGVDFHTARRVIDGRELDVLAILCKASGFDRALFLTFALLILGGDEGMARAREYGDLYNELSRDTALRTMRFWRVRREGGESAAA